MYIFYGVICVAALILFFKLRFSKMTHKTQPKTRAFYSLDTKGLTLEERVVVLEEFVTLTIAMELHSLNYHAVLKMDKIKEITPNVASRLISTTKTIP